MDYGRKPNHGWWINNWKQMNSENQKYCVIVPVFNGESSIEELTDQIVMSFEKSQ